MDMTVDSIARSPTPSQSERKIYGTIMWKSILLAIGSIFAFLIVQTYMIPSSNVITRFCGWILIGCSLFCAVAFLVAAFACHGAAKFGPNSRIRIFK